jgi:hypothetical protein
MRTIEHDVAERVTQALEEFDIDSECFIDEHGNVTSMQTDELSPAQRTAAMAIGRKNGFRVYGAHECVQFFPKAAE